MYVFIFSSANYGMYMYGKYVLMCNDNIGFYMGMHLRCFMLESDDPTVTYPWIKW